MDAQVDQHQQLANTIDNTLMPSVKRADVKTYLADIKPTVESHLSKAKAIQSKLGPSASAK